MRFALLTMLLLPSSSVSGALAPLSREELTGQAHVIVTGNVGSYERSTEEAPTGGEIRRFAMSFQVVAIEKGTPGTAPLQVHGWIREGGPPGGIGVVTMSDHRTTLEEVLPRDDDTPSTLLRLYLRRRAAGGYDILEPNGLEVLGPLPPPASARPYRPVWILVALAVAVAMVAAVVAFASKRRDP